MDAVLVHVAVYVAIAVYDLSALEAPLPCAVSLSNLVLKILLPLVYVPLLIGQFSLVPGLIRCKCSHIRTHYSSSKCLNFRFLGGRIFTPTTKANQPM